NLPPLCGLAIADRLSTNDGAQNPTPLEMKKFLLSGLSFVIAFALAFLVTRGVKRPESPVEGPSEGSSREASHPYSAIGQGPVQSREASARAFVTGLSGDPELRHKQLAQKFLELAKKSPNIWTMDVAFGDLLL